MGQVHSFHFITEAERPPKPSDRVTQALTAGQKLAPGPLAVSHVVRVSHNSRRGGILWLSIGG